MTYQVQLDTFRGPLDLLLYLVKRAEIDLRNLPISKITDQYLSYLGVIKMVDVEGAGEFVVMAGTLIELKSKVVLPRNELEQDEDEEDPRQELVRQLIEYKQFKEAAQLLDEQAERQSQRHARCPPPTAASKSPTPLQHVELWDLVSAFGRILHETLADQEAEIVADQTPMHVYVDRILAELRRADYVAFAALFTPPYHRSRLVGMFLAVLELTRGFQIRAEQMDTFGEIWLTLAPEGELAGYSQNLTSDGSEAA